MTLLTLPGRASPTTDTIAAPLEAVLNWEYRQPVQRVRALYDQAAKGQWTADDIDWSIEVPFGAPLQDDSDFSMDAFRTSELSKYGPDFWSQFRWQFQAWMVSQFLHGEQGALLAASRLVEVIPDHDAKFFAATQAMDEARHVDVLSRYVDEKLPAAYDVSGPLHALLRDLLSDSRWDITALGMQVIIEGLAIAGFRLSRSTFHDPLIQDISDRIGRDESRHISFGVLALEGLYDQMTSAERTEREDFVIEAADLMRRRFLLEEVWDRLGVDETEGREFAMHNAMMVRYRQTIFVKVVQALRRIGLMTPRVNERFSEMNLIGGR